MTRIMKCYCDKCNKEIKEADIFQITYQYPEEYFDVIDTQVRELCEDCAIELDRYLRNVPEWV